MALVSVAAGAPSPAEAAARLIVEAPPALEGVLRDVARAFRTRHEDVDVELRFAATNHGEGRPADVRVSADMASTPHGAPVRFAGDRLVLVTRRGWVVPPAIVGVAQNLLGGSPGAPGGGDAPGGAAGAVPDRGELGRVRTVLRSLARPGARIVLADSTTQAGRDAVRALERMAADPLLGTAFRSAVQDNAAGLEPGATDALEMVAGGEADATFVHAADALRAPSPVGVTALPPEYAVEVAYTAAPATDAPSPEATAFVEFLSGDWARSILRRHGFGE